MEWIELNDVEYGECIVLGGRAGEILMVDCGSINQTVRRGDVPLNARYEEIARRYEGAMDRYFLLTHYHRDHLSGFLRIIDSNPGYFSKVFLPCAPTDSAGNPLLLEFALFAYLFLPPQSDSFQVNTACVKIFRTLSEKLGAERIFTLCAGEIFRFDQVDYEVLWPDADGYPFPQAVKDANEAMNVCFASPFQPDCVRKFLRLKEDFLSLYKKCCEALRASNRALPEKRRRYLEGLEGTLNQLESLREELNLSPAAYSVREILQDPVNAGAYTDCANAASVVFQNIRKGGPGAQDILMTGDATPDTMAGLMDKLHDGYYVLKAPHHGTASGYSNLFADMSAAHILISNGEYHAGGAVAQEYIDRQDSLRHCTNTNACRWFETTGACCNRLSYCYDQKDGPGLALKCSAATGSSKAGGCAIRSVGPHGVLHCFCDGKAGQERN